MDKYYFTSILDVHCQFQREKSSSGECHQKRLSTDNPVPQAKRMCRSSKLSISSTTSEAPSNSSDLQNVLSTIIIPGSPTSIMVGGVSTIPSTSMLLSSTSGGSKDPHFKQDAAKPKGESDVVSNVEMLQAGPLSPIQVILCIPASLVLMARHLNGSALYTYMVSPSCIKSIDIKGESVLK